MFLRLPWEIKRAQRYKDRGVKPLVQNLVFVMYAFFVNPNFITKAFAILFIAILNLLMQPVKLVAKFFNSMTVVLGRLSVQVCGNGILFWVTL